MGSQTNDSSICYNVDTNKSFQLGSQHRSCLLIRSALELATWELLSIAPRLTQCAIEKIVDMAVCCTLRVSVRPSAPDYLILIGDTFSKTKIDK